MRNVRSWPVELRENLPLIVTTVVWTGSWIVVSRAFDLPAVTNEGAASYVRRLVWFFVTNLLPVVALLIPLQHLLRGGRTGDLVRPDIWRSVARRYGTRRVVGGFLVALVCMPIFFGTYRDWKTAVPAIVPFYFDPAFEAAERWLHGGRMPWELIHGLLGRPARTQIIDNLYIFWFEVQLGVVLWMSFTQRRWLRARFFIAYILMYVLMGHLMATAFSAVGPPYYGRVIEGPDPFAPLLAYLQQVSDETALFAVGIQANLWGGYVGTYDGPISGIAAFPSLHVGAATMFFLVALSVNRWLAAAFFAFAAVTMIGSVHLGWHYALDGYASIVLVPVIWLASGRLASRYLRWASLDALADPSAPEDLRRVDARDAEADQRSEGVHEALVPGGSV